MNQAFQRMGQGEETSQVLFSREVCKPLRTVLHCFKLGDVMKELPHTHGCFVCGESNPLGLKLRLHGDGETVQGRFTPRTEHIGFKGVTHGGLLATVLDEVMVWACAVQTRRFAFCAEMSVRFLQPASPGVELTAIGRLTEDRRGRVFQASGELVDSSGAVIATSTGRYLPIKGDAAKGMEEDLVGDISSVIDPL